MARQASINFPIKIHSNYASCQEKHSFLPPSLFTKLLTLVVFTPAENKIPTSFFLSLNNVRRGKMKEFSTKAHFSMRGKQVLMSLVCNISRVWCPINSDLLFNKIEMNITCSACNIFLIRRTAWLQDNWHSTSAKMFIKILYWINLQTFLFYSAKFFYLSSLREKVLHLTS